MSPSTTSPFGRAFPEDGLARGVDLLSQQIWCWGRDILRPEGNVLLEQGFERLIAPPDKANKKNIYALSPASGRTVILRGFGIVYIDERICLCLLVFACILCICSYLLVFVCICKYL